MNDTTERIEITFDGVPLNDAGRKAILLQDVIRDKAPGLETRLDKVDPNSQDAGSILAIILGAEAVSILARSAPILARGIANFLAKDRATITIKKNGEVVAAGLKSEDAARIAEAFAPPK